MFLIFAAYSKVGPEDYAVHSQATVLDLRQATIHTQLAAVHKAGVV
jgi:hypothetical protein